MHLISMIFFLHVLKLQQTVQEERVARILHGSRTHTITSPTQSPISSHSPTSIHHSARTHTITSSTHSPISSHSPPPLHHSARTHTITSPTHSPISSHSPPSIHQSARTHTITSPTHSSYQSSPFTNHSAHTHTSPHTRIHHFRTHQQYMLTTTQADAPTYHKNAHH